jgi:putative DNA primase/helicase
VAQYTFSPAIQIPVADGFDLIVKGAKRDFHGILAEVECWNGQMIHSDRIRPDIAADRHRFAKAVGVRFPALLAEVESKLMLSAQPIAERISEQAAEQITTPLAPGMIPNRYIVEDGGVFYEPPPSSDGTPQSPIRLCSRLDVIAFTRNEHNEEWGRLLLFKDAEGEEHKWALPMRLLATDGAEYRGELLSQGLQIAQGRLAHSHLSDYLQSQVPEIWVRCVDCVGWHDEVFVLPDGAITQKVEETVVLQIPQTHVNSYRQSGSLTGWQEEIGRLCVGNSRLAFGVSCALAAPLLKPMAEENGGFHFRGRSSIGKTTILKVAASVSGDPNPLPSWRATANGLEGIAAVHNDSLLCLDEIKQVDPREVGEVAYMLANGTGKQRANRYGVARARQNWRLPFLSSGELSLADHLREAGRRVQAGMEVRLADIPADSGVFGVFECLHGSATGDSFAHRLAEATKAEFGTPIRAYLTALVGDREACIEKVKRWRDDFVACYLPKGADGQVSRVAGRFGLIAAAGELATSLGVTHWPEKEAFGAAAACFDAWLMARGGAGAQEEREALAQVRKFFEQHEESRFSKWDERDSVRTFNRAGFRRSNSEGRTEYYVFTEVFRDEICHGLDHTFVSRVLADHGWLMLGADHKTTRTERLPGDRRVRCYRLTAKVLED